MDLSSLFRLSSTLSLLPLGFSFLPSFLPFYFHLNPNKPPERLRFELGTAAGSVYGVHFFSPSLCFIISFPSSPQLPRSFIGQSSYTICGRLLPHLTHGIQSTPLSPSV
ncbi:hypothetical protein B0H16DRAFT_1565159 [Mycena metata]|uniref:Uncharacterized protein n=1 Tax=Mycena metata TaxID=1033252 RepID=A0AAD7N0J3_9AGAR|nr:hypothetical protein B0H16DRAFT_1565159 [Mycena metata]